MTNIGPLNDDFIPTGPFTDEVTVINPAGLGTTRVPTGGLSPGGIGLGLPSASGAPSNTVFVVNIFGGGDVTGNVAVFNATEKSPYGIIEPLLDKDGNVKSNPITGAADGHQIGFYPVTPIALRIPARPSGPVFDPVTPCGRTIVQATDDRSNITFLVTASVPPDTYFDNVSLTGTGSPKGAKLNPSLVPPLVGPVTVSSKFGWKPKATDLGTHTLTFTAADEFGQTASCVVTIKIVERPDPGDFIPFAEFTPEVEINQRHKRFEVKGTFTLGLFSNGIDPPNEDLLLKLNDYELIIPAGSFEEDDDEFEFEGMLGHQRIKAELKNIDGDQWTFEIKGRNAPVSGIENPITVVLEFENDGGEAIVGGEIEGG